MLFFAGIADGSNNGGVIKTVVILAFSVAMAAKLLIEHPLQP